MKENQSILSQQGYQFNHLQKEITTNTFNHQEEDMKESFETTSMSQSSQDVLKNTKFNSKQNAELIHEYKSLLKEYNKAKINLVKNTKKYSKFKKNKYLGKNLQIGQGVFYITHEGIAKWYPNWNSVGKLGCPTQSNIDTTFASDEWNNTWASPGAKLPTTPPFITGTPMSGSTDGQACGLSGKNVYVNQMVSDTTVTYDNSYIDNGSANLTWTGGEPPDPVVVQNPNFSSPTIADNSFQYLGSAASVDSSTVPGWLFYGGVLLNNSTAWGYPTPYPNGNQCCSLQNTGYVGQTISNMASGTYTLTFYACGRPWGAGPNPVNLQLNSITFYTFTPPVNSWTSVSTTFTISEEGSSNTIGFVGTNSSGDLSTAIIDIQITSSGGGGSGSMSFNDCMNVAENTGYQYFGIENGNSSTGQGYCALTNDYVSTTNPGISYKTASTTALWASNTTGSNPGAYAKLTSLGTLEVFNSSDQSIYSSQGPSNSNYFGCYQDAAQYGYPRSFSGGPQQYGYTVDTCKSYAQDNSQSFFAIQDNSWCSTSSDLSQITNSGLASNCSKDSSGNIIGQGWSNAVYGTQPGFGCFITLQTDGNMVIYRGESPSDNQGSIWATGTNGKTQDSNPNWDSSKGKYGSDWVYNGFNGVLGSDNGFILYPNEFIYSSDGKLQLIMQSDGNLVLYTSTIGPNSLQDSDGNYMGGVGAIGLYKVSEVGDPSQLGKIAYINENGEALTYPSDNIVLGKKYNKMDNTDSGGSDYQVDGVNIAYANSSPEDCANTCNQYDDCYGYVFYPTNNNMCYPKTSDMSYSGTGYIKDATLYTREKRAKNRPSGVSGDTVNIGSNMFKTIPSAGNINMDGKYGLAKANSVDQQKLSQIEDRLSSLASQLGISSADFKTNDQTVTKQSMKNSIENSKTVKEFETIAKKIKDLKSENPMMKRIEDTSDINVLKDNYDYMFWGILGLGCVLVAMSVTKK